jgi:hypothetical protein
VAPAETASTEQISGQELFDSLPGGRVVLDHVAPDPVPAQGLGRPPPHAVTQDGLAVAQRRHDVAMAVSVTLPAVVPLTLPLGVGRERVLPNRLLANGAIFHVKDNETPGSSEVLGNRDPIVGRDRNIHRSKLLICLIVYRQLTRLFDLTSVGLSDG